MARATDELGAAIDGMESATLKILKSVETIDDNAKALTASIQDDYNAASRETSRTMFCVSMSSAISRILPASVSAK